VPRGSAPGRFTSAATINPLAVLAGGTAAPADVRDAGNGAVPRRHRGADTQIPPIPNLVSGQGRELILNLELRALQEKVLRRLIRVLRVTGAEFCKATEEAELKEDLAAAEFEQAGCETCEISQASAFLSLSGAPAQCSPGPDGVAFAGP